MILLCFAYIQSKAQNAPSTIANINTTIDSTRLIQDSILIYYNNGVEVGRDTVAGGSGSVFPDNTFEVFDNTTPANGLKFSLSGLTKDVTATIQDDDGTIAYISDLPSVEFVDSVGEIINNSYSVNDIIITKGFLSPGDEGLSTYVVLADSVSGYTVDSIAVIPVGSNYAVLQAEKDGVDIRSLGAIADDNTSDDTAYTKASNYAKAIGTQVKVDGGVYDIGGDLIIQTDLISSDRSTFKLLPNSDIYMFTLYNVDTVSVKGLIFDGNLANQDTVTYVSGYSSLRSESIIQAFRGAIDIRIDDCEFINSKCGGFALSYADASETQATYPTIETDYPGANKVPEKIAITNCRFENMGGQAVGISIPDGVDSTDTPFIHFSTDVIIRNNVHIDCGKINTSGGDVIPSQVNGDTYTINRVENILFDGCTFKNSGRFDAKLAYCTNVIFQNNTIINPIWGGVEFGGAESYSAYRLGTLTVQNNTFRVLQARSGQTTFPTFLVARGTATDANPNNATLWENLVVDGNHISYDSSWVTSWATIAGDVIAMNTFPKYRNVYITNNVAENFPRAFVGISDTYADSEKMNSINISGNIAKAFGFADVDNQSRFLKIQGSSDTATWKELNIIGNITINLGYVSEASRLAGENINISDNSFSSRDDNNTGIRFADVITNGLAYDTITIVNNILNDAIKFDNIESHSNVLNYANNSFTESGAYTVTYNSLGLDRETIETFPKLSENIHLFGDVPTLSIYDSDVTWSSNQKTAFGSIDDNLISKIVPLGASNGAVLHYGYDKNTSPNARAFDFRAYHENDPTTYSSFMFSAYKHNGSGGTTTLGSTAKIFQVNNNLTPQFSVYGNGNTRLYLYGLGNKEAGDIGKTLSNYTSAFATDGTLLDVLVGEMYFDNPFGGTDDLISTIDSAFVNSVFSIDGETGGAISGALTIDGFDDGISTTTSGSSISLDLYTPGLNTQTTLNATTEKVLYYDNINADEEMITVQNLFGGAIISQTDTTFDLLSSMVKFIQLDATSFTSHNIAFSNSVDGGQYKLHIINVVGEDTLIMPNNFLYPTQDTVGSIILDQGFVIEFAYDGTNYFWINDSDYSHFAESYQTGGTNTSITSGTPEQLNATTTGTVNTIVATSDFTVEADGDIQWTGANNSVLEITIDVSVSSASASSMYYYLAINSTAVGNSRIRQITGAGEYESASITYIDSDADTNDVYSIYAAPVTGTHNLTTASARIQVRKIK
jgi:hypothetical protein